MLKYLQYESFHLILLLHHSGAMIQSVKLLILVVFQTSLRNSIV